MRAWMSAQRGFARGGLMGAWLILAGLVLAASLAVSADTLDDGVRRIAKQLRCPICESVSVADSPAELAGQMRGVIRKKLEAGDSDQQILDYFVAAYGESVLLEPPRRGLGWVIWLGPLVVLAIGAAILGLVLRVWARSSRAVQPPGASVARNGQPGSNSDRIYEGAHVARARDELDSLREGLAR